MVRKPVTSKSPPGRSIAMFALVSRGPRCDLTMPCMLFDTFQRLGTGFQRRDRPAPVETKEKLLLTDGRERWLAVGVALLFFSFPL